MHPHQDVQQLLRLELARRPSAGGAAAGVDHLGVAVHDPRLGVGVEDRHLPGQPVAKHQVVVAEVGDQFAASLRQAAVPVADHAQVLGVSQVANALVGKAGHRRGGVVPGRVVADQQLEVAVGLREAAGDRLAQVRGAVVRRQHDRDAGGGHPPLNRPLRMGIEPARGALAGGPRPPSGVA